MTKKYIVTEDIPLVLKRLFFMNPFKQVMAESKFITHHFEKIFWKELDRGSYKWNAISSAEAKQQPLGGLLKVRPYIDQQDFFPRLFFHSDNLLKELDTFCHIRKQPIERIIFDLAKINEVEKSIFENCILKEPKMTSIDDFMKELE